VGINNFAASVEFQYSSPLKLKKTINYFKWAKH